MLRIAPRPYRPCHLAGPAASQAVGQAKEMRVGIHAKRHSELMNINWRLLPPPAWSKGSSWTLQFMLGATKQQLLQCPILADNDISLVGKKDLGNRISECWQACCRVIGRVLGRVFGNNDIIRLSVGSPQTRGHA